MRRALYDRRRRSVAAAPRRTPTHARHSVLVVDDVADTRDAIVELLAAKGFDAVGAASGAIALDLFKAGMLPCAVLLDLRMPDMDGITVLKALKQRWPDSEVIIITGYPTLESAKQALTLGAYDYLTKPVDPEQVIQASSAAWQHKRWALHSDAGPANDTNGHRGSSDLPDGLPHQPDFSRTPS
jgi:DNA-binding NtrC family response regulator